MIKRLILSLFFLTGLVFANEKLDNDLAYLTRLMKECYAGYEYNIEQGFDFDAAIENIRELYIKKSVESTKEYDSELLAQCINLELLEKLKVPDNHLQIVSKKQMYGVKQNFWYASKVYFTKQGEDYYTTFSLNFKIRRKSLYTGDKNNLYKIIRHNKEYFVFGLNSPYEIKTAELSLNNKQYKVKVKNKPVLLRYKENWIGIRKTEKTVYFSASDCIFMSWDNSSYNIQVKKFEDYVSELRRKNYENVIVDLRGNPGGLVDRLTPILSSLNFGGDYKNPNKVYKKINTINKGKRLDSELIRQAMEQFSKLNPGLENHVEIDSAYEYYAANQLEIYDFTPVYKGKLIILTDTNTASASELFISYSYLFENVYLIGTNTSGTIDFGALLDYYLPESNVRMHLASGSFKENEFLQNNSHWHGDTKGFYPDYWCNAATLLPTLIYITGDKKLKKKLRGLSIQLL